MNYWEVPTMWPDGDCWIIGGGPSMPRQFGVPGHIIDKVESKQDPISSYVPYFKPIFDKNVIGANLAFMLGDWISVFLFTDSQFFHTYWKDILEFPNLKVTCCHHLYRPLLHKSINVKRMKKDMRYGLTNQKDTLSWNHNTGGSAINFAVHAGAKRILLLGFDMGGGQVNGRTHWHEGYARYTTPTSPNAFKRFLRSFPPIAVEAKKKKVEILNLSPDSAIDVFPKVPLTEIL